MQRMIKYILLFVLAGFFCFPSRGYLDETVKDGVKIPDYVVKIEKENTYENPLVHEAEIKPNAMTKQIFEKSSVLIQNPYLVELFNQSKMKNAPLAIGYSARIYLGVWPLSYTSKDTHVNWYYQKINTNYMDNRSGTHTARMSYYQEAQKTVKGGFTSVVEQERDVQKMLLLKAEEKTKLPLSFEVTVGGATRGSGLYHVPAKCMGYLSAYVPAIHEEGEISYGAVYLDLKGNKRTLIVEKIRKEAVGAWIPIQNHIAFGFDYKNLSESGKQ